jgi:hypothetical protein
MEKFKSSAVILAILVLALAIFKKKLELSDEIFNQIVGFLVGALSQQGVTKVRKLHAAKKAAGSP